MVEIKHWWNWATAVALTLVWGNACQSEDSGAGSAGGAITDASAEASDGASGAAGVGSGGASGTGGAPDCDGSAGAGGLDEYGCPAVYDLPHFDGNPCGLCDPGQSTQCSPAGGCDWAATFNIECVPDGSLCARFSATCAGLSNECNWNGVPCPELAEAAWNASGAGPCASDEDCAAGHYCNVRVDNRMFCEGSVFVYAKDYCSDAGTDAGSDASDASP